MVHYQRAMWWWNSNNISVEDDSLACLIWVWYSNIFGCIFEIPIRLAMNIVYSNCNVYWIYCIDPHVCCFPSLQVAKYHHMLESNGNMYDVDIGYTVGWCTDLTLQEYVGGILIEIKPLATTYNGYNWGTSNLRICLCRCIYIYINI